MGQPPIVLRKGILVTIQYLKNVDEDEIGFFFTSIELEA